MRCFLLTGLVVLQVAGLGYGLPHLGSDVGDEDLSPGSWTQTTSATVKVIFPPGDAQKPALADHDPVITEHDQLESAQGDLNREMTELRALRAHLVQLEREVSAREEWLAAAIGRATTSSSAIADCETLSCVLGDILRKTRNGLLAIFTHHDSDDDSGGSNSTTPAIPVPPWRKPHNTTGDADDGTGRSPSQSPSPDDSSTDGRGLDLLYPLLIFSAVFLLASLLRRLVSRASFARRRSGGWDGLVLPSTEPHNSHSSPGEEPRLRRWLFWERVLKGLRDGWWKREGGIRLRESEAEAGYGYRDEKTGFQDDEGETYWEKYEGCMAEEEGQYVGGDGQGSWPAEHPEEDEFGAFEGGEENGVESERDCQSRRGSLDDLSSPHSSSETTSIGDEIASFRLAVDLVEHMFATEEQRIRET